MQTALRGALAVPAAALMLGAAEAGSTVALNFQSWYYESGAIPQTVGFGSGYQTTGFPVTAKAFGVEVADWTNTDPIAIKDPAVVNGIPFAGMSVDLNATNLWAGPYTGPGTTYADFGEAWPAGSVVQSHMTPGNYEATWSYIDNTGWEFKVSGLNAKFPNGYMVGLIGGGKTTATSSVEISDPDFNSLGTVAFTLLPDKMGVGASPVLTNDSIVFTNPNRPDPANCAVAGLIVTDKPVVTSCFPKTSLAATGASFTLTGTALGIGNLSYQWKRNGTDIPGAAAKNISYTVSSATAADIGTYTLVVSSSLYPANPATSEPVTVSVAAPVAVTWDGDTATSGAQNGSGSWDTTTANWWNGTADIVWNPINVASFGSGGNGSYTVSLAENISVQSGIIFNSGSYTIAPAASQTLTLTAPQSITTNVDAAITANLNGTAGFTKAGPAKLTLGGGNNPITGPVVVGAGTLAISRGGGGSSLTISPGATATTTVPDAIGYATNCSVLNVNGGTYNLGVTGNGLWSMDTTLNNASMTAVTGANWSYGGAGSKITNSGNSTISGGTFVLREGMPEDTLSIANTGSLIINSPISGNSRKVRLTGGGTTTFAGAGTNIYNVFVNGGTFSVTGRLTGTGLFMYDDTSLSVASSGSTPAISVSGFYILSDLPEPVGTNKVDFLSLSSTTVAPITTGDLMLEYPVTINVRSVTPVVGRYPLMATTTGSFSIASLTLGTLPSGITATLVDDLVNTGKIYLDVTAVAVPEIQWTGAVNGVWDINTTNNWSPAKYTDGSIVTFGDILGNTSVTLDATVVPGVVTFDNPTKNYSLSGTGAITGGTGLTKTGAGNLSINTNNTYTGPVILSGGTVTVGTGGTTGLLGGAGAITLEAATLVLDRSDAQTLGRQLIGSGGTLVKNGSGSLTMSAGTNNSDIIVNNGTLVATGGAFATAFAPGKLITINSGATLSTPNVHSLGSSVGGGGDVPVIAINGGNWLLGAEQYIRSLTMTAGSTTGTPAKDGIRTLSGSVYTINAAATSSTIASPLNLYNDLSLVVSDGAAADDLVISGVISNTKSITKSGPGRVLFSGPNTYTGTTTVTGGTLAVTGTSIPDTNKLVIDGGKVDVTGAETVDTLFYGAAQQVAGTYGSTASTATFKDNSRFSGTGVLTVVTGSSSGGFSAWATANAPSQTLAQDHDGDGVPNGIEYFMGLSGSASTASPGIQAGKISWPKGAGYTGVYGTDFTVQTSTNLSVWTDVPVSDPNLSNAAPLQYTLPAGSEKTFTRLKVTGP
ncbi:hypothetical protein GCM10023212_24070 [Luteolibacter yonseiensis]